MQAAAGPTPGTGSRGSQVSSHGLAESDCTVQYGFIQSFVVVIEGTALMMDAQALV
jgi:hypothetical protein